MDKNCTTADYIRVICSLIYQHFLQVFLGQGHSVFGGGCLEALELYSSYAMIEEKNYKCFLFRNVDKSCREDYKGTRTEKRQTLFS